MRIPSNRWAYAGAIGLLAAFYVVAAKFGLSLAYTTPQVTTVWPPAGIALAALLVFGYRLWPGIFIGAFMANVLSDEPWLVAFGIAIGNTLEALAGAYWLRTYGHFRISLDRLRDVVALFTFGALFSTAVSATIGVGSLCLGGLVPWPSYLSVWIVWWVGDMMGMLVVGTLLLLWSQRRLIMPFLGQISEMMIMLAFVLTVSLGIFMSPARGTSSIFPFTFFVFPLIVWASIRFRQIGAASATALIAIVAVWGTIHGTGPFTLPGDPEKNLILLQLFLFCVAMTGLTLAAVEAERKQGQSTLMARRRELEQLNRYLAESKSLVEQEKSRDEAMLLGIGDGLVVVDKDGLITMANPVFEKLTGWKINDAIGQRIENVLQAQNEDGQPIPNLEGPYSQALKTGRIITTGIGAKAYYYVRKDGRRFPVAITVAPFTRGRKIIGSINVFRDITKEVQVDRAKTEFVSIASHQLRTPLTIIRWSADMLRKYTEGVSPAQAKYLTAIEDTSRMMVELVDALLDVSRIEMGTLMIEPRPVNLGMLVNDIVEELKPLYQAKKHTCRITVDGDIPTIPLDPQLIRVVIHNLLTNAIKYTPRGGRIDVGVERAGDSVQVKVQDSGIGISQEEQSKIFMKMFRSEKAKSMEARGTGLGLYVAKAVVEQSGGKIWFESASEKGTTFYFTVPIHGVQRREGSKTLSTG